MSMVARLAAASLVAGLLAGIGATTPATAGGDGFCGLDGTPGLTTITWTGGSGRWSDDSHWPDRTGDDSPGDPSTDPASADHDYVCIDAGPGGVVTIGSDVNAVQVQAVDVAAGTTLRLDDDNGKLYTHGDPSTTPTVIRGTLDVDRSSSFGGPGRVRIDGRLEMVGVSAITGNSCFGVPQACTPATGTGELVISSGATFAVTGSRGLNLYGPYDVRVEGRMTMSGAGSYLGAGHGVAVTIAPGGELDLQNDGGIYEGHVTALPLATLDNAGTIRKSGGDGVSALDMTYSGAGQVVVESGSLTLRDGTSRKAAVSRGAALGTGRCTSTPTRQCTPAVSRKDQVNGRVRPPSLTRLSVVELAAKVRTRDVAGPIVYAFKGNRVVRVDLDYYRPGPPSGLQAWWAPSRQGTYQKVPACPSSGRLPAGRKNCVLDRVRHTGGARITVLSRAGGSLVARRSG